MCGKYCLTDAPDAQRRDLRPSDAAPIQTAQGMTTMRWGFQRPGGRGLFINARAESAAHKPLFAACVQSRRCIVPADAFYEWDADKRCYLFSARDHAPLYMAGLYTLDSDSTPRFVILTQSANADVSPIHHRMPCLLPSEECRALWLHSAMLATALLAASLQVPLVRCEQRAAAAGKPDTLSFL